MKLKSLNIITDQSVANPQEEFKKLANLYMLAHEKGFMSFFILAVSEFCSKVYVNYHFKEIMENREISISDFIRFLTEKPAMLIENLDFLYYAGEEGITIDKLIKTSKEVVLDVVKFFHHDRVYTVTDSVINQITLLSPKYLSESELESLRNGRVSYADIYNAVVLGSKFIFV